MWEGIIYSEGAEIQKEIDRSQFWVSVFLFMLWLISPLIGLGIILIPLYLLTN